MAKYDKFRNFARRSPFCPNRTNEIEPRFSQRHIAKNSGSGFGALRDFPQLLPIWEKIQQVSHRENVGKLIIFNLLTNITAAKHDFT